MERFHCKGLHKDLNFKCKTDKQDEEGDCPVHLAVKCSGPDADFEETVKILEKLRFVFDISEH